MPYDQILPNDTANEIVEFVTERFIGSASQMAATDAVELEMKKIAANPALGATIYGGPFESRRIRRFVVTVGDIARTVEFAYKVNPNTPSVVFSGFREVRDPAL